MTNLPKVWTSVDDPDVPETAECGRCAHKWAYHKLGVATECPHCGLRVVFVERHTLEWAFASYLRDTGLALQGIQGVALQETQRAFYAGAGHIFGTLSMLPEGSDQADAARDEIVTGFNADLRMFQEDVKAGRA